MNISKRKQGILAIICTIAMIVTSITVYNPREVKADTDYSKLTYNYKNKGEAYMKGSETTKSPWRVAIDESQSKGDIVKWMTTGAGNLNFYNEMFMNVTWHGDYSGATLEINGVKVEEGKEGVQVYPHEIHVNAKNWINNNAYNVVKVTSKDGSQYVTFIVATGDKVDTSSEETTVAQKPSAPTQIYANINDKQTDYTVGVVQEVAGATGYKFYVNETFVKEIAKDQVITIEEMEKHGLKRGEVNKFGISAFNSKGESAITTIDVPVPEKKEETTTPTPEYKDGEVLVNESNQTKEVPAYEGGDYWQNEYNNMPVKYVKGKKYVAEVVVSSTAAKKIKMVFQSVGDWAFVEAKSGYETSIAAGNKVKITYVFEATQSTDNGNFDIYLGSVADATTLVFESKKLTTYNEVPEGVQTGVEVLEAPGSTKYTVSIDGEERQCKEGEVISVPTEGQGYYDVTKKVAYAPGAKLPVNENMTLKSIKLSVTMTPGASIRLAAPTGLRFQTTVKSGNGIDADEILNSTTVTTGTLITTLDLYTDNGKTLTKDSKYNFLDIANNGWFNDGAKTETGKFCGSIIKIQSKNYGRAYIAVGYAIINYSDGTSQPVYAKVTENNAKSIKYVAEKVKKSEAYNKYKDIIDRYIDGKEISE